ncbi:MAG: ATP-binding protein [Bryobacterales bacterium]|nr:ATP-binding protein [Bryobacterales bacterium]
MIQRRVLSDVRERLRSQAAVALIGPRQVGKTTLARQIADEVNGAYFDLESSSDRSMVAEPALNLEPLEDKLVVLDEIHRAPEIFRELRGMIDRGRRRGRRTGRFLILGSASMDLLHQSGESLAGRIAYVPLDPIDASEVPADTVAQSALWARGGFPDSYTAPTDELSLAYRRDLVRTYLQRDVSAFGRRVPEETLGRLWTMLAHSQGTRLNAARLASGLGVSAPTVANYIDLLVDLLLVRRLRPCHSNVGKRMVKAPRVYVRDSGILHALLGLRDIRAVVGHPVVGPSWEGFAIETLLSVAPYPTHPSYYRTARGAEIDLVLELPGKSRPWAVEFKRTMNPSRALGKGFHSARKDLSPERSFVVYAGQERYLLAHDVEAISLKDMAGLVREA